MPAHVSQIISQIFVSVRTNAYNTVKSRQFIRFSDWLSTSMYVPTADKLIYDIILFSPSPALSRRVRNARYVPFRLPGIWLNRARVHSRLPLFGNRKRRNGYETRSCDNVPSFRLQRNASTPITRRISFVIVSQLRQRPAAWVNGLIRFAFARRTSCFFSSFKRFRPMSQFRRFSDFEVIWR